ncbi:hypothetical protein B0O99DRAFT_707816 [Bisporella sp. PMI_857]|nr:hypothetical protein B0O99DRAFT_707816 [Bisporella sp. PMI_857]
MYAQQLLFPGLALLGAAAAQSACSTATATINSPADAAQYTGCSTLRNVVIGSTASQSISINGPQQITGTLSSESAGQLTSLSSTTIGAIGNFQLFNLTLLSSLNFGSLTSVGTIDWSALPALSALSFPQSVQNASSVVITNTFLSTLDGINLKTVGLLDINNNNRLTKFETQVASITQGINIAANGKSLAISFPNLLYANNATFRDVKSITTPSLQSINGSLIFVNNYFTTYSAPNLTNVGDFANKDGSLAFVGNTALTNITFPGITSVGGGIQVANNSALQTVSFPALTQVGGAIDITGNFSTPNFASLDNVQGALNIQSTASIDCDALNKQLVDTGVVQGEHACTTTDDPNTLNADGTTNTSTAKPSSTAKDGAASASFGVSHAAAGLSVVGGLLQMLL